MLRKSRSTWGQHFDNFDNFALSKCFYRGNRFLTIVDGIEQDGLDCVCGPIPYRLLYVSRAIPHEVSSILYSENRFRICRPNPGGPIPLENLGSNALASLTSLSIRLNSCSCVARHIYPNPAGMPDFGYFAIQHVTKHANGAPTSLLAR
jgi:hypothetical protein